MDDEMLERLGPKFERLRVRFAELERQLSEGQAFSNPQRGQELSREHRRLDAALRVWDEFRRVKDELAANAALIEEAAGDAELLGLAEAEQERLEERLDAMTKEVQLALLPRDPDEDRNVIVEIRAGTGGDEAALFASDLFRMYARFVEKVGGWKLEVIEASPSDLGGFREVIFQVTGEGVFRPFRFESGVHRVQRVPATEAGGRIHTSTATVAVMPEAKEVDLELKADELRIEVCRSGGPGGQGVNTTDSAVQVMHLPTGMIVRCQDGRSQIKNKEKALQILRSRLLSLKREEEEAKYAAQRRSQVGTGDRNEKIRTYNYPQNRITDHRINLTLHDLPGFMDGAIAEMLEALAARSMEERLAALEG